MATSKIFTNENCVGCNQCISKCPCDEANVAVNKGGTHILEIDPDKCICCGECIRSCSHNARYFVDDTERFLSDLKSGKRIPILVAPALRSNVPEWPRLLGYLKNNRIKRNLWHLIRRRYLYMGTLTFSCQKSRRRRSYTTMPGNCKLYRKVCPRFIVTPFPDSQSGNVHGNFYEER